MSLRFLTRHINHFVCVLDITFRWKHSFCLTVIKSCRILNAPELAFAIFSGSKETPQNTGICLIGQQGKTTLWLSPTPAPEERDHIWFCISPTEHSKLTNTKYFYHLSVSIWNCQPRSIQNVLVSASPAEHANPQHPVSSCCLSLYPVEFLCCLSLKLD